MYATITSNDTGIMKQCSRLSPMPTSVRLPRLSTRLGRANAFAQECQLVW